NRIGLIQSQSALAVEDVEPVSRQSQFFSFTHLDGVVNTHIKIHRRRRTARTDAVDDVRESSLSGTHGRNDRRTALHRKAFVVSIDRVRNQKLERSPIAAIELELVRPIVRQTSVSVVEQALKIEQRSDVRVRLPVVVT